MSQWSIDEDAMTIGWWSDDHQLLPPSGKCIPGSTRSEKAAAAPLHNMTHYPVDYDEDDDQDQDLHKMTHHPVDDDGKEEDQYVD